MSWRDRYEEVREFSEGLAAVKREGKWGFVNEYGREIVPCQYDEVRDFEKVGIPTRSIFGIYYLAADYLAAVRRGGQWGFVNQEGEEVVPCQYDEVRDFEEAGIRNYMAAVRRGDRWGFVNKEGKEVVPFRYEEVRGFFWGVAAVKRNGKWGFVNEEGHEVVRCQYGETELVIIMAAKAVGMFLYGR